MSNNVYKTIDVVGSSADSIEDAISGAIAKASETIDNLDWFEVGDIRGHISGGKVGHYQVGVKIGFRLN